LSLVCSQWLTAFVVLQCVVQKLRDVKTGERLVRIQQQVKVWLGRVGFGCPIDLVFPRESTLLLADDVRAEVAAGIVWLITMHE
jgi:hypothetical protein